MYILILAILAKALTMQSVKPNTSDIDDKERVYLGRSFGSNCLAGLLPLVFLGLWRWHSRDIVVAWRLLLHCKREGEVVCA
jgi:hypothetical protein